jgi:hypothetical protein
MREILKKVLPEVRRHEEKMGVKVQKGLLQHGRAVAGHNVGWAT